MSSRLSSARGADTRRSLSNMSTASASLAQTISSLDHGKPAAVIEIGSQLTRLGFAGEYEPRRIIRTQFHDMDLQFHSNFWKITGTPCKRTLLGFFRSIFYDYLLCMPRERRVVIVESVLCSVAMREAICEVLLEKMEVPAVLFVPSHLCATFPFNTDTALVVDVGYTETVALPVADGVTMLNNWETSTACASTLAERIQSMLIEHAMIELEDGTERTLNADEAKKLESTSIVEEIMVRYVFCPKSKRGKILQADPKSDVEQTVKVANFRVPFDTTSLRVPGFIRESACEVLFENRSLDDPGLPQMIYNVIAKLPVDLRRQMYSSLLFIGGVALIPGFLARIKEELEELGRVNQVKTTSEIKFYRFNENAVELYAGWLGASLFSAAQEGVASRSISRERWLAERRIPDWTDYVEHNIPCGRTDLGG